MTRRCESMQLCDWGPGPAVQAAAGERGREAAGVPEVPGALHRQGRRRAHAARGLRHPGRLSYRARLRLTSQVWILIVALDRLLAVPLSCWTSDGPEAFDVGSCRKYWKGGGAPEHAGEAALAEGVAARHQHARHNPLAAPHRQSDRAQDNWAVRKQRPGATVCS